MLSLLGFLIMVVGLLNLFRLAIFMIAADIYDVGNHRKNLVQKKRTWPSFSILIPAYNEEACIERAIRSVLAANYRKKEIVVIDDGSTDRTIEVVENLQRRFSRSNIRLITQPNSGKGSALNTGIKASSGELVMVLDADATIAKDSLKNSVKYFDDKRVKGVASSVRLDANDSWLGLIQRVEYLLSYRMKRSLTQLNIEYIIGGVGSVYRRSTLSQVSGYRTNTITEDIDLSMKVVSRGNKAYRVVFASDVQTTTQPVLSFGELVKQRTRWKQGRMQAFLRYKKLFLTRHKRHGKLLAWFQLPSALLGEVYLLIEPFFIATIIYVGFIYSNASSIALAFIIMSCFLIFNFIATEDEKWKDKFQLIFLSPVIYCLLPFLALVELISLCRTLKNWKLVSPNTKEKGHWVHVARKTVSYQ